MGGIWQRLQRIQKYKIGKRGESLCVYMRILVYVCMYVYIYVSYVRFVISDIKKKKKDSKIFKKGKYTCVKKASPKILKS